MIIRGYDAINAAQELKMPLGKYSEQSYRGFRLDLTVDKAARLANADQNLIFLELDVKSFPWSNFSSSQRRWGQSPENPASGSETNSKSRVTTTGLRCLRPLPKDGLS